MGEVYRARDTRLEREVAIKVLPAELASDTARLKRFEKEARSASALNHPNIVTIYDIGSEGGVSYIAMERVEGATLRELLAGGALPVKRLLPIATQIGEGLSKAHEAGIVHRDLKPENVMVTKDGLVKILDFGLAKLTSTMSGSGQGSQLPTMTGTTPGMVVGTVGYMSPEQASGQALDFRSDQFSFGSILYEMATGRRAFQKKTAIDTLAAILNEEPPPIGSVNPQVPAPLRWIAERCLAKDPEARYASTKDLARELAAVGGHVTELSSGATPAVAPRRRTGLKLALAAAALVAASLFAGRSLWKGASSPLPSFQRLTFGLGFVDVARFSPDGRTIVYSAHWDGKPPHIFLTRPEAPESQRLDLPDASLMSVSSRGDLAIVSGKAQIGYDGPGWWFAGGTLATVPLAGGAPREIAEDVRFAEWAPDGKGMLIVRGDRIEFPIGKVIHEGQAVLPRFSPSGERVAFIENSRVHVTDVAGKELVASHQGGPFSVHGLAWSPSGEEVWFNDGGSLHTMNLAGKERPLLRLPRSATVKDVSRDGRLLLGLDIYRQEVWAGSFSEPREKNLTVFAQANVMGISADGKALLDNERGSFYLLRTDGAPPKKLGEGFGSELSPDGKWVAVVRPGPPSRLVLVPTGAGEERLLESGGVEEYDILEICWSGDGRTLLFFGREKGHRGRLYLQGVSGGSPRPLTPDGLHTQSTSISPDGRFVLVEEDGYWIYPVDGSPKRPVSGLRKGVDSIWRNWSADGRFIYAWDPTQLPYRVFRVELATGKREPWKTITPQDPAGILHGDLVLTPDGKSYAYNCYRDLSDLFLVTGVR